MPRVITGLDSPHKSAAQSKQKESPFSLCGREEVALSLSVLPLTEQGKIPSIQDPGPFKVGRLA